MDKLASNDLSWNESLHLLGQRVKGLIRYPLFRVGRNSGRKIVFLVWDVWFSCFIAANYVDQLRTSSLEMAIYELSWAYDGQIVDLQHFICSKRCWKARFLSFSNRVAVKKECSEE